MKNIYTQASMPVKAFRTSRLLFALLLLVLFQAANASWYQPANSYQNFQKIKMVTTSIGYAIGENAVVMTTIDGGTTWTPLALQYAKSVTGNQVYFTDMSFVSTTVGYVVGYEGAAFKTIDGGRTWLQITTINTLNPSYNCVFFTSADIGYVADETGQLYKTINGGLTWFNLTTGITTGIRCIYFSDAQTGWFAGVGGILKKTTNAGSTWTSQTSNTNAVILSFSFISGTTGWFNTPTLVFKTTDGGATWSNVSTITTGIVQLNFIDANTGWVVTQDFSNQIRKTTNGGVTWTTQYFNNVAYMTSVYFVNANTGYACGFYANIIKTTNGGATWTPVNYCATKSANLYAASFCTSSADGWMVGDYGTVTKSTNGGTNFTEQTSGTTTLLTGVSAFSSTTAWFCGIGGVLSKTTDGGVTWVAQTSGVSTILYDIRFNTVSNGLCVGDQGKILRTVNGGTTWTPVTSGTTSALRSVFYASATVVFVAGHGGTLLKSTDGGATWSVLSSGTTANLIGCHFISTTEGYACGVNGTILKTTNGGTNWSAQSTGTTKYFTKIVFKTSTYGWAVGQDGMLAYTTNAGVTWNILTRLYATQIVNCIALVNNGDFIAGSQVGIIGKFSESCPPPAPTNYTSAASAIVCTGEYTNLTAKGEGKISWYTASTGGTYLGSGDTYQTPNLTANITYYVQDSTCSASTRIGIPITIGTPTILTTTPATSCGPSSVTLAATTSAGVIGWYVAASGGSPIATGTTFTTPSLSTTTTYYAEALAGLCSSTRVPVIATIQAIPSVSSVQQGVRCGTGTVDLSAVVSAGTANWYATSTGGSILFTGLTATTPSISTTTNYFVEAFNGGCSSARTLVTATVNPIPTISAVQSASRCGSGSVVLSVTASAGTINWYTAASGGSSFATGASLTTPSLNATTSYYVDATNNNCTSSRTMVTATINPVPDRTTTKSGFTITATQTGATYKWINCNGNIPVPNATNQSFTPTANGSYAVVVGLGTCLDTSDCVTVSGVGINQSSSNALVKIFPNPSRDRITISANSEGLFELSNELGQVVKHFQLDEKNKFTIEITGLNNGVYFLSNTSYGENYRTKIVILN